MFSRIKRIFKRNKPTEQTPPNGKLGYSIQEIAEETGLLPSEVEKEIRILQEKGMVTIWYYDNKVYVVPVKGSLKTIEKLIAEQNKPHDNMYR